MKPITDYLSWPMEEDIERVLTNLSPEHKLELSVALIQSASQESKMQSLSPIAQSPITTKF